jgi:hypothetical protein
MILRLSALRSHCACLALCAVRLALMSPLDCDPAIDASTSRSPRRSFADRTAARCAVFRPVVCVHVRMLPAADQTGASLNSFAINVMSSCYNLLHFNCLHKVWSCRYSSFRCCSCWAETVAVSGDTKRKRRTARGATLHDWRWTMYPLGASKTMQPAGLTAGNAP